MTESDFFLSVFLDNKIMKFNINDNETSFVGLTTDFVRKKFTKCKTWFYWHYFCEFMQESRAFAFLNRNNFYYQWTKRSIISLSYQFLSWDYFFLTYFRAKHEELPPFNSLSIQNPSNRQTKKIAFQASIIFLIFSP